MVTKFVELLCAQLIASRMIAAGDREVYAFGIRALFTQSAHLLLAVSLGGAFGLFWESILFLAAYMPLRIYAGGYHAPTQARCFLASLAMVFVVLVILQGIPAQLQFAAAFGLAAVAAAVVLRFAPVEHENKPLDAAEQIVYQRKARRMTALIATGIVICFFCGSKTGALTLSLSLSAESILILLELRKQSTRRMVRQAAEQ